jgi:hypothetical protein
VPEPNFALGNGHGIYRDDRLKKLPALSPKQEILDTFGRSGWSAEAAYLPSRLKYLAKAKPLEIDGSLISVALSYEGDWTAEKE